LWIGTFETTFSTARRWLLGVVSLWKFPHQLTERHEDSGEGDHKERLVPDRPDQPSHGHALKQDQELDPRSFRRLPSTSWEKAVVESLQ